MKNGVVFIRIIIAIIIVFTLVLIVNQIYKHNFVSIKTESAVMGEIEESVKATGVFYRDEDVIGKHQSQYLDVIRTEGERVAAGGTIARVYTDEQSAIEQTEIRHIEERIATYEEVLSNSGSYTSASQGIEQEIYSCLNSIADYAHDENAHDAFKLSDNLMIEIMKKKIASGDIVHYDTVLQDLRQELADLKKSVGESVRAIKTEESGHFSLVTDGLEQQLTTESLESLEVDTFDDVVEQC
ncbi:MAG: hypothetical protein IJN82_03875, partial [Clostridia bacterium]|nr:hypothetical protein [Clostridia bacterium]